MKSKFAAVAATLLLSCAPLMAQFVHQEVKSGKRHVQTIAIMPLEVQIIKVGMKGGEPMMEDSLETQKALTPIFANVLEKQGYSVDQQTLSPVAMGKDTALQYSVDDLQKKFDDILKHMKRKPQDVHKGRYTLADDVTKLPTAENTDALLFVRATGRALTSGRRLFSLAIGAPGGLINTFDMDIALVDARSGDVLYFVEPELLRNVSVDPGKADGGIRKAFKSFVKASPPKVASKAETKDKVSGNTDAQLEH